MNNLEQEGWLFSVRNSTNITPEIRERRAKTKVIQRCCRPITERERELLNEVNRNIMSSQKYYRELLDFYHAVDNNPHCDAEDLESLKGTIIDARIRCNNAHYIRYGKSDFK